MLMIDSQKMTNYKLWQKLQLKKGIWKKDNDQVKHETNYIMLYTRSLGALWGPDFLLEAFWASWPRTSHPFDGVVEPSGLSRHHCVYIPLAHEDGKDPDTLTKTGLRTLLLFKILKGIPDTC